MTKDKRCGNEDDNNFHVNANCTDNTCHVNANCTDNTCLCMDGYDGDGVNCTGELSIFFMLKKV